MMDQSPTTRARAPLNRSAPRPTATPRKTNRRALILALVLGVVAAVLTVLLLGGRGDASSDQVAALFGDVTLHKYRWDQRYTSSEYGDLMRSYSGTQAMSPPQQKALIGDVCALIDTEFGGAITRPLVMTLSLGRRG